MGYHSSIELVYDASAPSRPHLVEADGGSGAGAGGLHGGGGRGRHVRSRSDSHALPGGVGVYGAVATEQRRRSGGLRHSKSLVQSDGDDWDENMMTEEEPHDRDHDDVLVADQRYDGEGGVEVTRQPSSSAHDGGSVWGAPMMADAANFRHWVYQPSERARPQRQRQDGRPPQVQRKFSQSQLQTPHLIPDEPPSNNRPRSIIRNKKRRPPSPDPPPHLLGGYIYDDDLDEDEGPAPHAADALAGDLLDVSSISAEDIDDDDQTFLGECLGMMDNACDLAPALCRNVTWMGPDVVTETWTRPTIKKHEVGRFFYQRDDYREFKIQYRLRSQNGEDSDDDSDSGQQQPPVQTASPTEMEYDYCSASAAAAQAEAALCGASEAFWSCFPSASSAANTEGTSAA